jgi:hypothetical protein
VRDFQNEVRQYGMPDRYQPIVFAAASGWYLKLVQKMDGQKRDRDASDQVALRTSLRARWGEKYQENAAHMNTFIDLIPPESAHALRNARGPDGRGILNDQHIADLFARAGHDLSASADRPASSPAPSNSSADEKRIREIEKEMRNNRREYNRDEDTQREYRELLERRQQREQGS